MKISDKQVFDGRFLVDNGYVDWLMDIGAQEAYSYLSGFFARWKAVIERLDVNEIRGGLRAISYAGGLQSKVYWPGSSAGTVELMSLVNWSGNFFLDFLSQRDDLAEESSMWWDDLGVTLSYDDEDVLDDSLDPVRHLLFQILLRSVDSSLPLAQAGALNGLWGLKHPHSLHELQLRRVGGAWATPWLQSEADKLIERLEQ
jgi:hypothetical protein